MEQNASSKPVTVIAKLVAKSGKESALEKELIALISPTKLEAGCVEYVLHRSQKNPAELVICETWSSPAALEAHHAMPYMRELMGKMEGLLAEPFQVSFLEKLS
jgi:quinol monooxygenase YgiN